MRNSLCVICLIHLLTMKGIWAKNMENKYFFCKKLLKCSMYIIKLLIYGHEIVQECCIAEPTMRPLPELVTKLNPTTPDPTPEPEKNTPSPKDNNVVSYCSNYCYNQRK